VRRVVIARHGDTFAPGEPVLRIGTRTDLPLTRRGRQQGAALGAAFSALGWRFDRVLTGPLRRTRETAHAAGWGAEVAHWLAEIDHGPDEGRPEPEVAARIGEAALAAWERDAAPPPGWQVAADARLASWRGLLLAEGDGATLVVTSAGAARFAPLALNQVPACGPKLRTGAFGVFENAQLVAWNLRPGEEMPGLVPTMPD